MSAVPCCEVCSFVIIFRRYSYHWWKNAWSLSVFSRQPLSFLHAATAFSLHTCHWHYTNYQLYTTKMFFYPVTYSSQAWITITSWLVWRADEIWWQYCLLVNITKIAAPGPINMYIKSLAQSELIDASTSVWEENREKFRIDMQSYYFLLRTVFWEGKIGVGVFHSKPDTDADGVIGSDTRLKLFLDQKHIDCGNSEI